MPIVVIVLVWGSIKVGDALASIVHMAGLPDDASDREREWTPVFVLAKRLRSRIKQRRKEKGQEPKGGVLNLLVKLVFGLLFRASFIGIAGGLIVLLAIGSVHRSAEKHAGCVLQAVASAGTLDIVTAAVLVLASMAGVTSLVQGGSQLAAGQVVDRTDPADEDAVGAQKPMSPALVVLLTIVSLIVSFAALYAAFVASNGAGITGSPCRFNMADALYFSASVGATAGFGDISPTSPMLRVVASAELVIFFAVLAVFLQMLWARPEQTDSGGR